MRQKLRYIRAFAACMRTYPSDILKLSCHDCRTSYSGVIRRHGADNIKFAVRLIRTWVHPFTAVAEVAAEAALENIPFIEFHFALSAEKNVECKALRVEVTDNVISAVG